MVRKFNAVWRKKARWLGVLTIFKQPLNSHAQLFRIKNYRQPPFVSMTPAYHAAESLGIRRPVG